MESDWEDLVIKEEPALVAGYSVYYEDIENPLSTPNGVKNMRVDNTVTPISE